jgi:hypothetical protein
MDSVRPKHVVSNFFIFLFLIITSIRKLLVVLLTVSPYQHYSYSDSSYPSSGVSFFMSNDVIKIPKYILFILSQT